MNNTKTGRRTKSKSGNAIVKKTKYRKPHDEVFREKSTHKNNVSLKKKNAR
jgi:hypothetical protein